MLLHVCSYIERGEVNHHFSMHSCEKEMQIFELKRREKEKDILMASVLHDQRAPLGSSQFYNQKAMTQISNLLESQSQKVNDEVTEILIGCHQDIKISNNCLNILEQVSKGILDYSLIKLNKIKCTY